MFRALTSIVSFSQKAQIAFASKVMVGLFFCILFLFPVISAQAQNIAPPISGVPPLSGLTIGSDGTPVQAVITAIKVGLPAAGGRTVSASDGSFTLSGVPDGQYQLCAVDKGGNYLDPCTWSTSPVKVTISAAQPISNFRLVLAKGVSLQVRVNDPGQFLGAAVPGSNQEPATLVVGAMMLHHPMQPFSMVSKDSGGRTFQSVVPINASVLVKVLGTGFTLADVSGNAVNLKLGAPIPVQTSQSQQSLSFTVTGVVARAVTIP